MRDLARLFHSLEDETRLRILALLLAAGELCVCDLIAALRLPQSTVSRHLAHLKNAGWLRDRREGVWIYYAIEPALPTLHETLLPALRACLRESDHGQADLARLQGFGAGNRCA